MSADLADLTALAGHEALGLDALTVLLRGLVAVPSANPGIWEGALADHCEAWLRRHTAAELHRVELAPGRPSLAAVLGSGGPRLVLNGHLDTVPVGDEALWSVDPYAGEVRGGELYGRGACDMKAGLAVALAVARVLSDRPDALGGTLVLHLAAGEEAAEPGTSSLIAAGFGGDVGICLEPTELAVGTAARGSAQVDVRVHGRSAHGGRPDLAANPVLALGDVLEAILAEGVAAGEATHPLLGHGTCTPTLVHAGGERANVIPDLAVFSTDCRLVPGQSGDDRRRGLAARLEALAPRHPELRFEAVEGRYGFPAAAVPDDSPLARRVGTALERVAGRPARFYGTPYASDFSRLVAEGGMDAVTFGPGSIDHAHRPDERVALDELRSAAITVALVATELLGG